jgi:hypothetical protein
MTILDASSKLFDWFSLSDKFNFEEDIHKIIPKAKKEEKAALKCALTEFEGLDIVKRTEINSEEYWVLKKGFQTFEQDVTLSPKTSMLICQLTNAFCKVLGVEDEECDPKDIKEIDINNLILICYHFINETDDTADPSQN